MRDEDGLRERRERLGSPNPLEPKPAGSRRLVSSQFLIGIVIVVVGASLLLDNLGLISSREILRFWPVILILVGLRDLLVTRDGARAMRGTLLVAFGVLFLLDNLEVFEFSIVGLWPLLLILFGAHMLIRSLSAPARADEDGAEDAAEFDDFAMLGAVKRSIRSSAFRGGSASAFMGGVDLDLSKSRMQGNRAVVNVFALMGGIVLRIPEDWAVESNVTALMGGVEDKTRPPVEPAGTLVLEGSAIMGGIEIKD